jgi:CDP-diacylglycerol---glycerol-3-phosphate 3-phosphatidyltransferase
MSIPNQLTVLRIILSPIFLYFFFGNGAEMKLISFIIFTVAALTDWYDGLIARKYGYITKWGQFLDPLADKILTSSAFIGFYYIGYVDLWMLIIIIIRDIGITLLRSIAEFQNKTIVTTYSAKVKTFFQMTVVFYVLFFYSFKEFDFINNLLGNLIYYLIHPYFIYFLMFVVTLLTLYTGIMYLVDNRKTIRDLCINADRF